MAWDDQDAIDDLGPDEKSIAGLPTRARDYLIPAADNKGHSQRLYCRVVPQVGRLVQQVLESRLYPFRTAGDVVRFCVVYTVKRLLVAPGVDSIWRRVEVMMAQLAEEEEQIQFLGFFQKTQEIVDRYTIDNSIGEARRVVASMKAQIDAMPDSEPYWKGRYQGEVLRRFKPLLDAAGSEGSWDHIESSHGDDESADHAIV